MATVPQTSDMRLFVPFEKIDHEKRLVYGVLTSEAVDEQGEIVDWNATKEALAKWAGNIREMHQPKAVGKRVRVDLDDVNKRAYLLAYISKGAEDTWQKIKEGVLRGFSIGGQKLETRKEMVKVNGQTKEVTRITKYRLTEVSLVDNPANPECTFQIVKMVDGVPTQTEVVEDPPLANAWAKAGAIVTTRPGEDEDLERLLRDHGFRKVATISRYSSDELAKAIEAELPCPKCGKTQWEAAWRGGGGTLLCKFCGSRFEVGLCDEEASAMEKGRGQGQGVGGPRQGDGGADACVCPECGYSEPHERGEPCREKRCPQCGAPLQGADEDELEEEQAPAGGDEGEEAGEGAGEEEELRTADEPDDLLKADTWLPKGIKQTDLWDSDFLALHEDYKKGKMPKSRGRKLPIAIHGKVHPRGWMAAYKALMGSRGGVKLGPGWPSKEELLRRLERRRPKKYIKKNPDGTYSFTEAFWRDYGHAMRRKSARKFVDGPASGGMLQAEVVWTKRKASLGGGSTVQKFAIIPEDALETIKLADGTQVLAIAENTEGLTVEIDGGLDTLEKRLSEPSAEELAKEREEKLLTQRIKKLQAEIEDLRKRLAQPRPRPMVVERPQRVVGGDVLQKAAGEAAATDERERQILKAITGREDATIEEAVEVVKGWVETGQLTPERDRLRQQLLQIRLSKL